jgi:Tfp pilus assembly protein PilF
LTVQFGFRCFFVGLLLAALTVSVDAAPRKPLDDNEVLERLPQRAQDPAARELAQLRARASAAATNPALAAHLAEAYFDLSLARGDPRYVGYANAVVARFGDPLPASLRLVRGQLRQYRHDFPGALEDFAAALAADPNLAAAHAWRGAIFLVQADYLAAEKECAALQDLGRDGLAAGCKGLALAYGGNLTDATRLLQQALGSSSDPANRLWLLTRLGEVAAWRGESVTAEGFFRQALRLGRDDVYLLAAWADFLLDAGRPQEVLGALAAWEAADSLLLRLAEAGTLLQRPEAARWAQALDERFAAARARGDETHMAEEARFHLRLRKDAKEALRLAAENYRIQREPRDARILLESAIAAGDAAAAQPVRDWLRTSGFEDATLRRLGQELCGAVSPCGTALGGRR